MAFNTIPHASFPFDESPWISHFRDADAAAKAAKLHAAGTADYAGHDAFARHILASQPGENPFTNYSGPFGEGEPGQNVAPHQPPQLYGEYFSHYTPPGGAPGQGPFADMTHQPVPGAAGPAGLKPPGSY